MFLMARTDYVKVMRQSDEIVDLKNYKSGGYNGVNLIE